MNMILVVVLSLLAASHGASVEKRGLQTLDSLTLQTFTQIFRKTLLDKVALEWNVTLDMSHKLAADMEVCKTKVTAQADKCKAQAKSTCNESPSFTDYLNFVNPATYLAGPLNDLAGKFGDIKDLLGDQASGFFTSMGGLANSVSGSFSSAFDAMKNSFSQLGDLVSSLGGVGTDLTNQIGQGATDLGNTLAGGLTDAGNALGHAGSSIGSAIGSVFGKREIDAQTRKCMERCSSCSALLLPTQAQMIGAVCGQDIITRNNTINSRAQKLKQIVDASTDKAHSIVVKVEFDPASMNGMMQITHVFITTELNGHASRYQTHIPYSMMNMPSTAQKMALEYWNKVH